MNTISSTSKRRLEEQGFRGYTGEEISRLRFGIRFAYVSCGTVVLIGLALKAMPLLFIALGIAVLGVILPNHPFDYPYNALVRHWLNRPRLPRRPVQGRFACSMASLMLTAILFCFYQGLDVAAYIIGAGLLSSATLVSFLDLCLPSKIYNALFEKNAVKQHQAA